MQHIDAQEFNEIMIETAQTFQVDLTEGILRTHWNAYADLSLDDVRRAFSRHVQTARRFPVPADIRDLALVGQAQAPMDVGVDEAWAIAVRLADDRDTVIVTSPIAEAWGEVESLHAGGDVYGARRAFVEIYPRKLAEAGRGGRVIGWHVSAGSDRQLLAGRVADALKARLLSIEQAREFCVEAPSPDLVRGLLAAEGARDEAMRDNLDRLRGFLAASVVDLGGSPTGE